jgi:ABC-type nitrate/sulfonate/bicarbonate transport system permease component
VDRRDELWSAGIYTFSEALGGFVIGSTLGVLGDRAGQVPLARPGVDAVRDRGERGSDHCLRADHQSVVGPLEKTSKMAIAAILVFFPVMVNTLRGLTSVRPSSIELMRTYAAGELAIFRRVRLPNSLPYLFAALKVGTVLAMIGAPWRILPQLARGARVPDPNSAALFQFELAWAAITVASVLGILFYSSVALVERLTMSWHPSSRTD